MVYCGKAVDRPLPYSKFIINQISFLTAQKKGNLSIPLDLYHEVIIFQFLLPITYGYLSRLIFSAKQYVPFVE